MNDPNNSSPAVKTHRFSIATFVKSALMFIVSIFTAFTSANKRGERKEDDDRVEGFYTSDIEQVLEDERQKILGRRKQAGVEFQKTPEVKELSKPQSAYKDALESADRRPIGLAFSGGGIRSATFNLGLVQGLSRFRALPWVDYLSSVSGGGFTAGCMTSLLSMDKKTVSSTGKSSRSEYFHFNTQWEYFPFNPELKVFDSTGVASQGEPSDNVGPPLQKGSNRQLEYLRSMGNYLIPRSGWLSRDFLRGIGAVLVRISYTLAIFMLAILAFSAFHYGISAGLSPGITRNFSISEVDKNVELSSNPEIEKMSLNLQLENSEIPVDLPISTPADESTEPDDEGSEVEINLVYLIFGDYSKSPDTIKPSDKYPATRDTYIQTAFCGLVFSLIFGTILTLIYRKDPTRKYKLGTWKSPMKELSLENYLAINNLRLVALIFFVVLFILTIWLWVAEFNGWPKSIGDLTGFYWAWIPIIGIMITGFLWLEFKEFNDYRWINRGLEEKLRIDGLVIKVVTAIFAWALVLLISLLRFRFSRIIEPQIFWIWLPAVFIFGSLSGLTLFRLFPLTTHIFAEKEKAYGTGKLPFLVERYFKAVRISRDPNYKEVYSGGVDFRTSVWSNAEFRSVFWSLQGLALFGLLFSLVFSALLLPHYFSTAKDADAATAIPLATTIVSAIWATIISNAVGKADFQAKNLLAKIITLPSEIRNIVLGLLVIILNLSIIFLIESRIDNLDVGQAYIIGIVSLGLLWVLGRFADFNYLTQHFFFRDRIADIALKTDVNTDDGHAHTVRDDREERLYWITPANCSAPYHLVMTSLNLPGSWHMKYRDQKAVPFVFSKLYSGSEITGYAKNGIGQYRGGVTKYSRSLGLSGAAISPAMGYRTFFAQAFMTTLLNARLGLWMTSPDQYRSENLKKDPKPHRNERGVFWPAYLWDELRGGINERKPLVYLTDGEHTGDNIGLYPLFQRRCRIIIAGDAGQDSQALCKALFRVIRQAKYDMGIKVDINVDALAPTKFDAEKKEADPSLSHFAIGKIYYPEVIDALGNKNDAETGWLIYFKPSVTGDDPSSILKYWDNHKTDFPHPSTADQFYDEQQFELQRALGEWTVEYTINKVNDHYKDIIKADEAKSTGDRRKRREIRKIKTRIEFLEELISQGQIDFEILYKNPAIVPDMLETLYEITNNEGNKFRTGE